MRNTTKEDNHFNSDIEQDEGDSNLHKDFFSLTRVNNPNNNNDKSTFFKEAPPTLYHR